MVHDGRLIKRAHGPHLKTEGINIEEVKLMQYVEDRIDQALDEALMLTFPASDPVTVYIPEVGTAADPAAQEGAVSAASTR
ncbi:MAG TPA: hypothetical protein VIQ62_08510 [Burkholderiales bacterium]|jgi:hypothetical protein